MPVSHSKLIWFYIITFLITLKESSSSAIEDNHNKENGDINTNMETNCSTYNFPKSKRSTGDNGDDAVKVESPWNYLFRNIQNNPELINEHLAKHRAIPNKTTLGQIYTHPAFTSPSTYYELLRTTTTIKSTLISNSKNENIDNRRVTVEPKPVTDINNIWDSNEKATAITVKNSTTQKAFSVAIDNTKSYVNLGDTNEHNTHATTKSLSVFDKTTIGSITIPKTGDYSTKLNTPAEYLKTTNLNSQVSTTDIFFYQPLTTTTPKYEPRAPERFSTESPSTLLSENQLSTNKTSEISNKSFFEANKLHGDTILRRASETETEYQITNGVSEESLKKKYIIKVNNTDNSKERKESQHNRTDYQNNNITNLNANIESKSKSINMEVSEPATGHIINEVLELNTKASVNKDKSGAENTNVNDGILQIKDRENKETQNSTKTSKDNIKTSTSKVSQISKDTRSKLNTTKIDTSLKKTDSKDEASIEKQIENTRIFDKRTKVLEQTIKKSGNTDPKKVSSTNLLREDLEIHLTDITSKETTINDIAGSVTSNRSNIHFDASKNKNDVYTKKTISRDDIRSNVNSKSIPGAVSTTESAKTEETKHKNDTKIEEELKSKNHEIGDNEKPEYFENIGKNETMVNTVLESVEFQSKFEDEFKIKSEPTGERMLPGDDEVYDESTTSEIQDENISNEGSDILGSNSISEKTKLISPSNITCSESPLERTSTEDINTLRKDLTTLNDKLKLVGLVLIELGNILLQDKPDTVCPIPTCINDAGEKKVYPPKCLNLDVFNILEKKN